MLPGSFQTRTKTKNSLESPITMSAALTVLETTPSLSHSDYVDACNNYDELEAPQKKAISEYEESRDERSILQPQYQRH